MAWTYNPNLSAPKDKVRFLLGDTNSAFPLLQDEEISFVLMEENMQIKPASVRLCKALIAKFSSQVNYTIGPEKVEAGERCKAFRTLLRDIQGTTRYGVPTIETTAVFSYGMNDNK